MTIKSDATNPTSRCRDTGMCKSWTVEQKTTTAATDGIRHMINRDD